MTLYPDCNDEEPLIINASADAKIFPTENLTHGNRIFFCRALFSKIKLNRNLIGFWIIGLCNNFSYVVMLSAAFDILQTQNGEKQKNNTTGSTNTTDEFICHPTSTGVVLLADVLATLIIKLTAPFYMQKINYHIRVAIVILFSYASLLTVAYSPNISVSLLGVIFASISSGAGEIIFLSITSHFKTTTISAWSSGTGMAGVAGALSYAGLTQAGLSGRNTLLVLLIVPTLLLVTFWGVLDLPEELKCIICCNSQREPLLDNKKNEPTTKMQDVTRFMSMKEKIILIKPLLIFMMPLFLVYLAEYTINQGLFELLYYHISWLNQAEQYRWFQVDYQIGVFISRSSVNIFRIKKLYIPVIIQWCILTFLLCEVAFRFIPNIWIALIIIFIEGLCGGSVYVNAFYMISEKVQIQLREFSLGLASVADSFGIVIAGFISTPIHNALCRLKSN